MSVGDPVSAYQDWSPYQRLEEAAAVYLRDPVLGLEALRGVVDPAAVLGFTLERELDEDDGTLYQEIALTDGQRLILWIGDESISDDDDDDDDDERGIPLLTSSIRVWPLATIADVLLDVKYRTDGNRRELYKVELTLHTAIGDYVKAKTPEKTDIYCEQMYFTKSVEDGGRAQAERLVQFGRLVGSHV